MTTAQAQSILGLAPTFTSHELKRAYRRTAATHHPDRGGSTERMVMVNEAYALLSSPGDVDDDWEADYRAEPEHPAERYIRRVSIVLAALWWITGIFDLVGQPRRLRTWILIGFPFAYLIVWALLRWTVRGAIHVYDLARRMSRQTDPEPAD